jgi:peptidoglycan-N-acetylglucosamine deacetylase
MHKWICYLIPILWLTGCTIDHAKSQDQASNDSHLHGTHPRKQSRTSKLPSLSLAELQHKYPDSFFFAGSASKQQVALTFDDGPDLIYTPKILDILKKHQVKATFFLVGENAQRYPQIVRRIIHEGHVVANHSYDHPNFAKVNEVQFHDQIQKTEEILQKLTGYSPKLIRPPYGNINEEQIKWTTSQHFTVINWNVDSLDWRGLTADQVIHNVLDSTSSGSIVLQHSAGGKRGKLSGSVQALDVIIDRLKKNGIRMVTVPELLDIPKALPANS